MSAPRPYETSPFHPPALFTPNTKINLYIYTNLFQLILPCGNCIVSPNIVHLLFAHALSLNHVFQDSVPFCSPRILIVQNKARHRSSTQTHRNIALAQ